MHQFCYAMLTALFFSMPAYAADSSEPLLPDWSYDGDMDGQDNWGMLSQAYDLCETGTEQSPIAIGSTQPSYLPLISWDYHPTPMTIIATRHAIELGFTQPNSGLEEKGSHYRLKTIQLHSPSEHTVREDFFPLELELVHEDQTGKKLILAVFARIGEENKELGRALAKLPQGSLSLDPALLLPESRGYYAYTGSLTYPPCTQGVEWRVLKTPITISKEQLKSITALTGRNARLSQPVYLRSVKESIP